MSNILLAITCLALGKLLQHVKQFPDTSAHVLNSYVIYVALPALFFQLLSKTPIEKLTLMDIVAPTRPAGFSDYTKVRTGDLADPATADVDQELAIDGVGNGEPVDVVAYVRTLEQVDGGRRLPEAPQPRQRQS